MPVDLDLVKKYNRPGPRYTSYPTAPRFSTDVDANDWRSLVQANNQSAERDLSLYFHFPFCDTLCWFCGCTMMVSRRPEPIAEYIDVLFREMEQLAPMLHSDRKVSQMHFGGGTPTHLSPDQLRSVGRQIHQLFTFTDDAEIGCEMDPRGLARDHIKALTELGVNRISLGVQDFDARVQQAINRIHDEALVGQVLDWVRGEGITSINLDLIYGLPHQSTTSFARTIDTILSFQPDRLAVFSYAHVPWMKPHQKLIKEEDLPAPEEKLRMLKYVIETLTDNGYVYIGMDHFARADDELTIAQQEGTLQRNFQGYSTRSGADIYAFGMSAISQLDTAYAQHTKDLNAYREKILKGELPVEKGYVLTEEDRIRRHVIMRLMCDMKLEYARLDSDLGIDSAAHLAEEFERITEFEDDGLLERTPGGMVVTHAGRLFIRNIAMAFDAYLEHMPTGFSKTV